MIPLNTYNFIRWYTGTGQTLPLVDPLPYPGTRGDMVRQIYDEGCRVYKPVIAPGEEFSWFMNSPLPVDHNTSDLRFAVVMHTTTVQSFPVVQFFSDPTVGSTSEWLYGYYTLDPVKSGTAHLVIYTQSDMAVQYFSNPIEIMQQDVAESKTTYVEYSNSKNMYFLPYTNIGLIQKIRLHLYNTGMEPEGNLSQYRAENTGRLRNYKSQPDLNYTFTCGPFDREAHKAMVVLTQHDTIKLNGRYYITKEDYSTNMARESTLSLGEWSTYEQDFSKINRYRDQVAASGGFDIRTVGDNDDVRVISNQNAAT